MQIRSSMHAGLVASRPVKRWRETLAILATYATGDFPALCDALARRLVRGLARHLNNSVWL